MQRSSFWRDENGAGSAEFVLVLIPFAALIFAIIYGALMFYATQTLQSATEAAARCYAVDRAQCATTGAVQTYAAAQYKGPNIGPVFTPTFPTGCGHTVTATGTFPINLVVYSKNLTLSASACFP
jgi:Flp pilus assembly protein TadG